MKKVFAWIIILTLIGGGVAAYLWWRNNQATEAQSQSILRTEQVTRGDLTITVSASGNVAVNERIDLRLDTPGTVSHIAVDVNEHVRAGQELARLDTVELERAIQQAEIALEQAKLNLSILTKPPAEDDVALARLAEQSAAQALKAAELGKQTAEVDANAMIVQAQRARENAFKDYRSVEGTSAEENARIKYENAEEQERITKINAELTTEQAQSQWLAAYNNYQRATENLRKLEQGVDENQIRQAELQIEQAQLNLEQAQERVADATIRAPFAGLVAAVNVQEGILAPLGSPAFILVDDSQFYADVMVDEIDIGKISVGQSVSVTLDAYPNIVLAGSVESVAPAAVNVGGIISYQLRVRLTETNGTTPRDAMTASILVHTDTITDIVRIPSWAVRMDQSSGESVLYCYVLRADGVPERRNITLGRYNETFSEVLSGLDEGNTVVLLAEERTLFDLGSTN